MRKRDLRGSQRAFPARFERDGERIESGLKLLQLRSARSPSCARVRFAVDSYRRFLFMANEELKVGDIVQLKSGGPKMTIEVIDNFGDDHDKALCAWFDEKSKREDHIFELTSLQKV